MASLTQPTNVIPTDASTIPSSTDTTSLPSPVLATVLTSGVFFAIVILSLIVYVSLALYRRYSAAVLRRNTHVVDSFTVEGFPRRSISAAKPPMYSLYPLDSGAIPKHNSSFRRDSKSAFGFLPYTPALRVPNAPFYPSAGNPLSLSHSDTLPRPRGPYHDFVDVHSAPPPLPPSARRSRFARYTMPPPTPMDETTGLPMWIDLRTPPPVYDGGMERSQREMLRLKRLTRFAQSRRQRP